MQRQRQDLSFAVRQLTDNSNSLYNQLSKRSDATCSWSETDLDSKSEKNDQVSHTDMKSQDKVNSLDNKNNFENSEGSFAHGYLQDKQEIKTVRIVKREAERRQRDREKIDKTIQSLDNVLDEENYILEEYNLNRSRSLLQSESTNYSNTNPFKCSELWSSKRASDSNTNDETPYLISMGDENEFYRNSKFDPLHSAKKDSEASLVYQSEAAKQIITEMSSNDHLLGAQRQRRLVPKEKKRHNTAPHHVNARTVELMQAEKELSNQNV